MNVDEWMKSANSLSPNDMEAGEFFSVDALILLLSAQSLRTWIVDKCINVNPAKLEGLHVKPLVLGDQCIKHHLPYLNMVAKVAVQYGKYLTCKLHLRQYQAKPCKKKKQFQVNFKQSSVVVHLMIPVWLFLFS